MYGEIVIVALAIVIDLVVGDPRSLPHPVVIIGRAISVLEQRWNQGSDKRRRLLGFYSPPPLCWARLASLG